MIPQSFGAFVVFLGLVAPGILFELLRSRHRLNSSESAFREIARIAIASLSFTVAALTVMTLARIWLPSLVVDVGAWVRDGNRYVQENFKLIAVNGLVGLLLACGLATVWHFCLSKKSGSGTLSAQSLWFQSFHLARPVGTSTWVRVQLNDGTTFFGMVKAYTAGGKFDEREILLEGVHLTRIDPPVQGGDPRVVEVGSQWEGVIIRGAEIRHITYHYVDDTTGERKFSNRYEELLEENPSDLPAALQE
ncbi:DUF6338 family protein [Saccharothrix sp. HUAS TT1]|uniref:DUF6338 family protein n=1 Tax=unclassified Saccharothrix TaxID=2593673 RepID=UPI00345B811D